MVIEALNPNGPSPLYHQLLILLQEQLKNGVWKPGDKLPTEEVLCQRFNVSRTTVRHTLGRLERAGAIERRPGIGTLVVNPKVTELILSNATGTFSGNYVGNKKYGTKVISVCVKIAPLEVIEKMDLNKSDRINEIIRIRYVDQESLFWTIAFVPYHVAPGFADKDFVTYSFFDILRDDYGIVPTSAVRTIEAYSANELDVQYLGVKPGASMHIVECVSYLENGRPFEYSKNHYRGDRTKFYIQINSNEKNQNQ